jgi:GxxExxY protein
MRHLRLGPGLLETVYETVLEHELKKRGMRVQRQVAITIRYEDLVCEDAFRADLVVDDCVVVELKSLETIMPIHKKQLLTYLRLMDKRLGLLINFGSPLIKEGISRVANSLPEESDEGK